MRPWGDRFRLASDHSVVPNANNSAYHIAARRAEEQEGDLVLHPDRQRADRTGAPQLGQRPPAQQIAREKGSATSRRAKKLPMRHQRSRQRKPAFHQSQQGSTSTGVPSGKLLYQCPFGAAFRAGPCEGRPTCRHTLQTVIGHARRVRHKPIDPRTAMLHQAHSRRHAPVGIVERNGGQMLYTSHTAANRHSPGFFQNGTRIGKPQGIKPSRNQTIPGKPSIPIRAATASDFRPIRSLQLSPLPIRAATPNPSRDAPSEPRPSGSGFPEPTVTSLRPASGLAPRLPLPVEADIHSVPMQLIGTALLALLCAHLPLSAQQAKPSCDRCSASYISREELDAYLKRAPARATNSVADQQVRAANVGKANVDVGVVYRNATQAEGSAVRRARPGKRGLLHSRRVRDPRHRLRHRRTEAAARGLPIRQAAQRSGGNGSAIRNGATYQLKAGDAIIIPAGVGHWFTKVDDHIRYIMIRIDPDKVTPTKDEAASKADLAGRSACGGNPSTKRRLRRFRGGSPFAAVIASTNP